VGNYSSLSDVCLETFCEILRVNDFEVKKHCLFCMLACVSACAAIGCLTRQSVDPVHCPYLTSVSDGSNNTGQLNVTHSTAAGSELSHTLLAVDVSGSLPASTASECLVTEAAQLQLDPVSSLIEDRSDDQQSRLTQYPLSDLSSVLAEQTLVSSQTVCANSTEITQYPLSDISSDGSGRAVELASLHQFRLNDSPDNITTTAHCEMDNDVVVDRSGPRVGLPESSMQRDGESVNQCLSVNFVDNNGSGCVTSDAAAADMNVARSELSDDQPKCDGDVDFLVSLDTSRSRAVSCPLSPTYTNDLSRTVDTSNMTLGPDDIDRRLAVGTGSFMLSHVKHAGAVADMAGLDSAVVSSQLASCYSGSEPVTVTDASTKTLPFGAGMVRTVADLQHADSSSVAVSLPAAGAILRPGDEKLSDSGLSSLPASSEPGCMRQTDVTDDAYKASAAAAVVEGSGRPLELPPSQAAVTSDSAVRKLDGVTTDEEQTSNQMQQLVMETSGNSAKCSRKMADGSEASAIVSAVQTSVLVSHSTAAYSRNDIARCAVVRGSDDNVNDRSVTIEQHDTVMQGHIVSDNHHTYSAVSKESDRYKAELVANVESQSQHLTMTTEKPSDTTDADLALPLEQDSGSELDGDDLAEDVKMILAKYRIRRAPIGSDSIPVASSANVDNDFMPDAVDTLSKDASTVQDLDTCSSSSGDTLASRVKALLIKAHSENHGKTLPTAASDETSQHASSVCSVCSSKNTSVNYNSLSRELDEIQMNLDSIRNSEKSSSGSHHSSNDSPCVRSQVVDESVRQESLALLLQQKADIDQLLQHSLVGPAGDSLLINDCGFSSDAGAATSGVKQMEAGTLNRELVLFEDQHELSPSSILTSSGTVEPLIALRAELDKDRYRDSNVLVNKDLLLTRTNVKTAERPMQLPVLLSNSTTFGPTSFPYTQFADTSLSGQMARKSFESLGSGTELLDAADDIEDTVSSIGSQNLQRSCAHGLADGQRVTDGSRDMSHSSAMEDAMHDTVGEVSSIHTDTHHSDATSCTQLIDCGSACSEVTGVDAAVKQLQQNVSNVFSADSYSTSTASSECRYDREAELLKQLSVRAAADQQIPALYDDEYHLTDAGLNQSYSTSCDLSPVPKCRSFDTVTSTRALFSQLDKAAAERHDQTTELQSSAACSDNSSTRSFHRNVQQTENLSYLQIEPEKEKGYEISNQCMSDNEDGRRPYMQEPYSVSSDKELSAFGAKFVSTACVEFTPLAPLPCGGDLSDNGSYDGDNELPFTVQLSYSGDGEVRSCGGAVMGQQLPVDETLGGGLDAAPRTHAVVSYSPPSVNLLQPYQ